MKNKPISNVANLHIRLILGAVRVDFYGKVRYNGSIGAAEVRDGG